MRAKPIVVVAPILASVLIMWSCGESQERRSPGGQPWEIHDGDYLNQKNETKDGSEWQMKSIGDFSRAYVHIQISAENHQQEGCIVLRLIDEEGHRHFPSVNPSGGDLSLVSIHKTQDKCMFDSWYKAEDEAQQPTSVAGEITSNSDLEHIDFDLSITFDNGEIVRLQGNEMPIERSIKSSY